MENITTLIQNELSQKRFVLQQLNSKRQVLEAEVALLEALLRKAPSVREAGGGAFLLARKTDMSSHISNSFENPRKRRGRDELGPTWDAIMREMVVRHPATMTYPDMEAVARSVGIVPNASALRAFMSQNQREPKSYVEQVARGVYRATPKAIEKFSR